MNQSTSVLENEHCLGFLSVSWITQKWNILVNICSFQAMGKKKVIYSYSSLDIIQNDMLPAPCNNTPKIQLILIDTSILMFIFCKALLMMEFSQWTRNLLFWCIEIEKFLWCKLSSLLLDSFPLQFYLTLCCRDLHSVPLCLLPGQRISSPRMGL